MQPVVATAFSRIAGVLAVFSLVAPAHASAEDAFTSVNRAEFDAFITASGVERSALGGCALDPWSTSCPPVSSVVASISETACASEVNPVDSPPPAPGGARAEVDPCGTTNPLLTVPYASLMPDNPVGGSATPMDHGTGAACGLRADGPERTYYSGTHDWYIRGRTMNHCLNGQGVTRMEAYVSLQRERLDGEEGYTQLDSKAATPHNGATLQYTPYATWDCNHNRSLLYRVESSAYSVVRGTGWFGVQRRTDNRACPE